MDLVARPEFCLILYHVVLKEEVGGALYECYTSTREGLGPKPHPHMGGYCEEHGGRGWQEGA